ncbi:MAG TPA: MFS transporter, partial [Gaiellaceae bacterium]|nr:MFS transporter [Gaiellaceae bacterium]
MRRLPATTVYYGLQFLLFMPTWVVVSVYLVQELHLSPLELVLMGTAMEAAVFLFEVPTGVVADTYSRRLSLIVGYLGMGVTWMLVGVVSQAWAIILLWAFWGLSYTFTSGAYQAWITDEVGVDKVGRLFLQGARIRYAGAVVGLLVQVAIAVVSLRAGVIAGGAITAACGLLCIFLMPETGFRRRPRAERGSPLAELRSTAASGVRYAWAAPVVVLLVGVDLFMGMSSEAFDRLKEAHFLRDVGLPAVGQLDPVVWFGIFWLVGMVLGFAGTGWLLRRFERGGRGLVTSSLFTLTTMEMAAMLVFALTGSTWVAIAALLGVFVARDLAGPLYTIWLNEQITDSSVRATVLSISGQADAIGQAAGGPVLG